MRIVSLNVNGLRAFERKCSVEFNRFCKDILLADIVCLQEIKGSATNLLKYHALVDYQTFSSFYKGGRHGVSTLVSKRLFCGKSEELVPGRVLKTYHGSFVLYNCYMPYYDESKEGDKSEVIGVYSKLQADLTADGIILCGDFNATYSMLDHYQYAVEVATLVDIGAWTCHPEMMSRFRSNGFKCEGEATLQMKKKLGLLRYLETTGDVGHRVDKTSPGQLELPYNFFDLEELERYFYKVYQRAWMRDLVGRYTDTFRAFNSGLCKYTCWNTKLNLRPSNLGTRIDYILCSKSIACTGAFIMPEIKGSDHCPVGAEFNLETCEDGNANLVRRSNNLLSFFKPV